MANLPESPEDVKKSVLKALGERDQEQVNQLYKVCCQDDKCDSDLSAFLVENCHKFTGVKRIDECVQSLNTEFMNYIEGPNGVSSCHKRQQKGEVNRL